jgi:hypothetical protein
VARRGAAQTRRAQPASARKPPPAVTLPSRCDTCESSDARLPRTLRRRRRGGESSQQWDLAGRPAAPARRRAAAAPGVRRQGGLAARCMGQHRGRRSEARGGRSRRSQWHRKRGRSDVSSHVRLSWHS